MDAQDYPIRHFEQMSSLATRLKELPAQVLEHQYTYDAFGSWVLSFRYRGQVLRVVFDGHEQEWRLERAGPGEGRWERVASHRGGDQWLEAGVSELLGHIRTAV